jgi:hypothetical protein
VPIGALGPSPKSTDAVPYWADKRPTSPVRRYSLVVAVLPCDPTTNWAPVKVIVITRQEPYVTSK